VATIGRESAFRHVRRKPRVETVPKTSATKATEVRAQVPESGATEGRAASAPQKTSAPRGVSPVLLSRYNRETLYQEVWSSPTRDVAKKYGVSDVALGKTCKKLLIPLPGRGYWNKVSAGKRVPKRPPLPPVPIMR
jgi:hypothetical protein